MTILTDARVVQDDQVVEGGWVRWEGERLAEVGRGHLPVDRHQPAGGRLVVPGFVDIHVHGGGGGSFTTGSAEDGAAVACFHRRHGTTTLLASLVTAPFADLLRQISALAELVDDETVAGLHLEGPFLSSARRGAHPRQLLRAPTPAALDQLLCRRPGAVRMATLAPELDGGIDAVAQVAAAGRCRPSVTPTPPTTSPTRRWTPGPGSRPTSSTRCGRSITANRVWSWH